MIKTLLRIFSVFVMLIALVLVVFFIVNLFMGTHPYIVSSDSMSDTINKGDMIFVKDIGYDKVKKDDIITFKLKNSNITVTHRVVSIDSETGLLYAKGDNNPGQDYTPVTPSNLVGIYVYKIPGFKFLVKK